MAVINGWWTRQGVFKPFFQVVFQGYDIDSILYICYDIDIDIICYVKNVKKMMTKLSHSLGQEIPEEERDDHDAVCLVKQYLHSTQLSQQPLLILPAKNLKNLQSRQPIQAIPTKSFPSETLKEFRKTAAFVEQEPFKLMEGSNYLRSLCDRSEKDEHAHAMPLSLYGLREDLFQGSDAALAAVSASKMKLATSRTSPQALQSDWWSIQQPDPTFQQSTKQDHFVPAL